MHPLDAAAKTTNEVNRMLIDPIQLWFTFSTTLVLVPIIYSEVQRGE